MLRLRTSTARPEPAPVLAAGDSSLFTGATRQRRPSMTPRSVMCGPMLSRTLTRWFDALADCDGASDVAHDGNSVDAGDAE